MLKLSLRILQYLLTGALLFCAVPAMAQPATGESKPVPEKVRLQLKWFNQFQFAGYFAAIEKGYYADEGLEVEIKERVLEKNFVKQVTSGESEYGVGDSGLLSQYANGEPIVALAAIFQHNPLVFMARQNSGIISPYEMVGKRVMSDIISTNEAPLRAMLAGTGITEKDYKLIPQSNNYDLLTQREVDVISGYLTDQPFYFKQQDVKVNIINPQNYGIDFYGDILFTSRKELLDHPGRAERFRRASLKGWRYALDHPDELIQIIHDKYHSKLSLQHLKFEAVETRKLILPDVIPIGQIEAQRMKAVADVYAGSGFNRPLSDNELAGFIYSENATGLNLTGEEKAWLAAHPVIRVGIDRDFAPYEWIDKDGNYVGMAADYMAVLEKKLGVRFQIIKDKSWADILGMAKRGELDMLSCAVNTPERSQYLTFTEPYKSTHAVIIDNGQGGFIGSLDHLHGKRVAVEKGYFMQELLQKHHPQIELLLAPDTHAALKLVVDGKADAYVGDAGSANYTIKKDGLLSLRFSGQTDYQSRHSVAITKNNPALASVIIKAMTSISKEEADTIFNRWLGLKIEQGIRTETLVKYAAGLLLLFLLFGYWVYRLRKEVAFRVAAESYEQSRSEILELLAVGAPLPDVLEAIVKSVEQSSPGALCSILLLDAEGRRLLHGASPSLPDSFNSAIHGLEIGMGVGSCGTAAFLGERVVVEDVQQHPYWAPFKELARKAGVGACWSEPIHGTTGQILGAIAIYHHTPASPTRKDDELIGRAASLAGIAIERHRTKEALDTSLASFRRLVDNIADEYFLYTYNVQGMFTYLSPSVGNMLGWQPEEFMHHFSTHLTDHPINLKVARKTELSLQGIRQEPYQIEIFHKDGSKRWLEVSESPVFNQQGEVIAVDGIAHDITEHMKVEDALREARDLAEHVARTKSEFLANMSHEIRTPMNAIVGLSQLALNREVSADVRDYLEKINISSESLLGILNDILDFSKMEAGKLGIENSAFGLGTILDNLYHLFSVRAEEKFLDFNIEVDSGIPRELVGDALRIQQILSNLVGNAIKFTEHGKVSIEARLLERENSQVRVRFSVSDTGIGISAEDQVKLFQPFSQADSSITRRFGGTGLGLAISHRLVQLMGGNFHLDSVPGQGSRFHFDLTLGVADIVPHRKEERRHGERTAGTLANNLREQGRMLNGARILVAEDNRINQQVVKEFLQLSGITVDIANHGGEALQMLEQHHYDAILMDVHMPVMGGIEATERIRKLPQHAGLPIIALTAGVTEEERNNCRNCGMNDFISKPVNPQELISTLCHWINPTQPHNDHPSPTMHATDTSLDDLPGFDLTNLKQMVGDNEDLIRQLLGSLLEDTATTGADIDSAIESNDLETARKLTHTVKGAAGNLGASDLYAAAVTLESRLKQGHVDPEARAGFHQALNATRAVLANLGGS